MQDEKAYTVTQINKYIKAVFDEDFILNGIKIEGEISNCSKRQSGHMYFTLKDEQSAISCVMFAQEAEGVTVENGVLAAVTGNISVYVKTGQYQLYAKKIGVKGGGSLHYKFERLKERLLKEGLFDERFKKPLPYEPKVIAVITSPEGAAVKDIITVSQRRNKLVKLAVFPVLVQGEFAAEEIANTIYDVNEQYRADIIIVARGGGSIEDLWAFNEEIVARAIFDSEIPVISAVGHQTDFTIADFTADLRAATPSVAAEIAVPLLADSYEIAVNAWYSICRSMDNILLRKAYGASMAAQRILSGAQASCKEKEKRVKDTFQTVDKRICAITENKQASLLNTIELLEAVSPLSVLKRGYSLSYKGGELVKSVNGIKEGDEITTTVIDGDIISCVKAVKGTDYV